MLRGALATPTRSGDAAGTLIVGTVLTFLGWVTVPVWAIAVVVAPPAVILAPLALAPTLVARGYYLQVVAGELGTPDVKGTPRFVRWGGLYRDGVKSALLTAGYLLPLFLALAGVATAVGLVGVGRVDPEPITDPVLGGGTADPAVTIPVLGTIGGFVFLLVVAYLLAFAYVRPAALSMLAATGRLRDAFRPSLVGPVAASGDYVVGWSLAAVVLLTGYTLAIPFVPLFVGIGLVFATRVIAHALYGRGSANALDDHLETHADRTTDPGARSTRDGTTDVGDGIGPALSGRGSRNGPVPAEAPVAVQTGRSVPPSSFPGVQNGGEDADRSRPEASVFHPAEPVEVDAKPSDRDDMGRGDSSPNDEATVDRDGDDVDGGFDWEPRIDG